MNNRYFFTGVPFYIKNKKKRDTKALVKRFASYYSPHRSLLVLDMGTAAFKAGLTIAIPLVVNIIFKKYLPDQNFKMLIITIAAIFTLATIVAAANYINIRWGHILGARMEADMRADLFRHLQKLSFSYFDNTKTGHIVSRISNDLLDRKSTL